MIPENMRQDLIERVKPSAPHASDCYFQINRAVQIANSIDEARAKITLDRDLSDAGRQKKMLGIVKSAAVELFEATKGYRGAVSRIKGERKSFVPKTPDRTDAVGELRRQEVRTFFRNMTPAERQIKAADPSIDDVMMDAILDASPTLSGFDGNLKHNFDELKKAYAERHYGEKARQLDEIEKDYGNVGAAFDIAVIELKKGVQMHEHEFKQIIETARKSVDERY